MTRRPRDSEKGNLPYSLSVEEASSFFGLTEEAFHRWIRDGRLQRDYHFFEVERKTVIIREAFIEFMKKEDGLRWIAKEEAKGRNPIETMNSGRRY